MSTDVKSMEVKRTQQTQQPTAQKNANAADPVSKDSPSILKQLPEFVGDVKTEFKKISWTSKEELIVYTQAVVGATFVLGLGVYIVDLLIQSCLWMLENVMRVVAG